MAAASTEKAAVICVFCGASDGKRPEYMAAARALAEAMHSAGAKLVYGGGNVGIMGEIARTLVGLSGTDAVHGVIPDALQKFEQGGPSGGGDAGTENGEKAAEGGGGGGGGRSGLRHWVDPEHGRVTVVSDMHTRKKMFWEDVKAGGPGSGFVALAGGFGTMEELMEMTTWNQLGIHDKPVVLLNTRNFFDGLIAWVDKAVEDGFIREGNRAIITVAQEPKDVIPLLSSYTISKDRMNLTWTSMSPVEEKKSPWK